jgi:hypothetical protein
MKRILLMTVSILVVSAPAVAQTQTQRELLVCMLRKGSFTQEGGFVQSPSDGGRRVLAISFQIPSRDKVELKSIAVYDPNRLLQSEPIGEMMLVDDGKRPLGVFAGKKGGATYTLVGTRSPTIGDPFRVDLFRTGISKDDTSRYWFAGTCMERRSDDIDKDFNDVKNLPPVIP